MAQDPSEDLLTGAPLVTPSRAGGKGMLLAGVVGACALGVGAGLWARPQADERRLPAGAVAKPAAAAAKAADRTLQIVVDDKPAPIGAPIEVLPATAARGGWRPDAAEDAAPLAPLRPPTGLVRVQAVEPIEVEAAPQTAARPAPKPVEPVARVVRAPPKAASDPEPKTVRAETTPVKARKAEPAAKLAKSAAAPKAKLAAAEQKAERLARKLAKTAPAKVKQAADSSKIRLAEARKAREAKAAEAARIEAARRDKARKIELARAAKAAERARVETARAEKARVAKARLEKVRAETARAEKARLAKASAERARAEKARLQQAALKKAAAKPAAPAPRLPKPTRDNPLRKASSRCASADPGAALVCADASLGAADRQLSRAYQQAEAAGVSAARLARQQERWLAARAQAAREAPWAVRDVYEARIAELNDMTRDARREY
jgi:hypothetical protein